MPADGVGQAVLEVEPLPVRAHGLVGVGERVRHRRPLERELAQVVLPTVGGGHEPGTGVVRDQGTDPFRPAVAAQEQRTVHRMEAAVLNG